MPSKKGREEKRREEDIIIIDGDVGRWERLILHRVRYYLIEYGSVRYCFSFFENQQNRKPNSPGNWNIINIQSCCHTGTYYIIIMEEINSKVNASLNILRRTPIQDSEKVSL